MAILIKTSNPIKKSPIYTIVPPLNYTKYSFCIIGGTPINRLHFTAIQRRFASAYKIVCFAPFGVELLFAICRARVSIILSHRGRVCQPPIYYGIS